MLPTAREKANQAEHEHHDSRWSTGAPGRLGVHGHIWRSLMHGEAKE